MNTGMDPILLERLVCPKCGQALNLISEDELRCGACKKIVRVENGKPIFTPVPAGMLAAPKLDQRFEAGLKMAASELAFFRENR